MDTKKVNESEEQQELIKYQKEHGQILEKKHKEYSFLQAHKHILDSDFDKYMLYRLPITEEQRERIYNNIVNDKKIYI